MKADPNIMNKMLVVTMPDNSTWGVPVYVIAENRAKAYAHEFNGDVQRSLAEDTVPLFQEDTYAIEDWASNNMDWDDVKDVAVLMPSNKPELEVDWQDGWVNGDKRFQ